MEGVLLLLSVGWVVFWLLDWYLNGRWWLWEIVSLVPGWAYLVFGVGLLVASLLYTQLEGVMAVAITIWLWWPSVDFNLFPSRPSTGFSRKLVLFNWNTEHWFTHNSAAQHIGIMKIADADVYHLQEAWAKGLEEKGVYNAEHDLLPHFPGYKVVQHLELVTMTKLPIVSSKAQIPFQRVDIQVGEKVISFYNVHVSVHIIPRVLLQQGWKEFLKLTQKRFEMRRQEYKLLYEELAGNPLPQVISGDFNTTTFMRASKWFRQQDYLDAFGANHFGLATTFKASYRLRWWRLDYVWGKAVNFVGYKCLPVGRLSDHLAQVAKIAA